MAINLMMEKTHPGIIFIAIGGMAACVLLLYVATRRSRPALTGTETDAWAQQIMDSATAYDLLDHTDSDRLAAWRNDIATTIEAARRQTSRSALKQQWLFFVGGVFLAVPLGVAGNLTYDSMFR